MCYEWISIKVELEQLYGLDTGLVSRRQGFIRMDYTRRHLTMERGSQLIDWAQLLPSGPDHQKTTAQSLGHASPPTLQ